MCALRHGDAHGEPGLRGRAIGFTSALPPRQLATSPFISEARGDAAAVAVIAGADDRAAGDIDFVRHVDHVERRAPVLVPFVAHQTCHSRAACLFVRRRCSHAEQACMQNQQLGSRSLRSDTVAIIPQIVTCTECRYRWLRLPATTFVITHSSSRSNRRVEWVLRQSRIRR
jgi:hypothetical protein